MSVPSKRRNLSSNGSSMAICLKHQITDDDDDDDDNDDAGGGCVGGHHVAMGVLTMIATMLGLSHCAVNCTGQLIAITTTTIGRGEEENDGCLSTSYTVHSSVHASRPSMLLWHSLRSIGLMETT